MGLAEIQTADRRLIVLRALDEGNYHANETVLRSVTEAFGHRPTREMIRADLSYLAEHSLIRLEKLPAQTGELWVAHLLQDGRDVAQGRVFPGVARREPG